MQVTLGLSVIDNFGGAAAAGAGAEGDEALGGASKKGALTDAELGYHMTPHDLKRLDAYARSMVDWHLVADLVPEVARLFFYRRFAGLNDEEGAGGSGGNGHGISLSTLQRALLVGIGLQRKNVDALQQELGAPASQLLALFNRAVRKINKALRTVQETAAESFLAKTSQISAKHAATGAADKMKPLQQSLREDLEEGSAKVAAEMQEKQKALLDGVDLSRYAVGGDDADWEEALKGAGALGGAGIISVKGKAKGKRRRAGDEDVEEEDGNANGSSAKRARTGDKEEKKKKKKKGKSKKKSKKR